MAAASSSLSLKEYLKRYESAPAEELTKTKSKKKKKPKPISAAAAAGVRIVDEDPVWQKPVELKESESEPSGDEKPQVDEDVEVKRMKRLEALRAQKPYHGISEDGSGWVSVSEPAQPSDSKEKDPDLSPPRQRRARFDTPSPERDEDRDLPLRRSRARHQSPGAEGQQGSPGGDLSPPRRARQTSVEPADLSPPRRGRWHSPEDDLSPTRRSRKDLEGDRDLSPPRRGRRHSPEDDLSPPRRSRKDLEDDHDLSPPRRRQSSQDAELSPPGKRRSQDHDLSPPRRSQKEHVAAKEAEMRRAGLFSGQEIKEEIEKIRKKESLRFAAMDPSVSGRGAEPVFRDKEGRRITKEEMLKSKEPEEKPKEKKLEWGKGLAQKREVEARARELELEKDKPFARTRDDPELDKMLKERVRWGDPMAHLVKRKHTEPILEDLGEDEKMKESGFIIPQTIPQHSWIKRGLDFPPNRYGIQPGRHWDGVDRSTGYEKEYFQRQNEKRAVESEAYLWAVADM